MTQEEKIDFRSKFAKCWDEFVAEYPTYADFPIREIAEHFFERGRSDIMDRVWSELKK